MDSKALKFWKEKLIPEVKVIDSNSGKYLEDLLDKYENFGLTGHSLLNEITFSPSYTLATSFYWAATEMGREHWVDIEAKLQEKGVYE